MIRKNILALLSLSTLLLLESCQMPKSSKEKDTIRTFYIPEVNEEYNPRDMQLKLKIEQEFIDNFPVRWDEKEKLTAFTVFLDVKTLSAISDLNVDDSNGANVAVVHLSIDPKDSIAARFNTSHPNFSPPLYSGNTPISGKIYGLSVRKSNKFRMENGPVDETYTIEDRKYDFYMECLDYGYAPNRSCSMHFLGLLSPPDSLKASKYALSVSISFPYSRLKNWKYLKDRVSDFVRDRGELVPYAPDRPRK